MTKKKEKKKKKEIYKIKIKYKIISKFLKTNFDTYK